MLVFLVALVLQVLPVPLALLGVPELPALLVQQALLVLLAFKVLRDLRAIPARKV